MTSMHAIYPFLQFMHDGKSMGDAFIKEGFVGNDQVRSDLIKAFDP